VRGRTLIAASAVVVTLAGAAPASSVTVTPLERSALKALATPRVTPTTKERGRVEIRRAAHLVRTLPAGRREHVAVVLGEITSFAGRMTEPRALSLLGELKANDDYFAKHYAPAPQTDITDADGLVYRYFAGRCFEFHPLANFGALNARVAGGDAEGAQRLAGALVARGVYQSTGGIGWEYTFPFGGGRAPWISGMAQAVGAQALARTAALTLGQTDSASLMGKARAAYQAIPRRLLTSVAAGPWIRLYSFTSLPVLNAQLQAVISLQSYAATAQDSDAAALAARMQRAAAATLPRFDTGYWSYYALPHDPSPLDYHQYVVSLLKRLAPADPRFADAAARFAAYEKQPPAFELDPGSLGTLRFWISKPSNVSVTTAAGPARRISVDGGWHTLSWGAPKRAGTYAVHVTASDSAGNRSSFDALPFVRATSTVTSRSTQAAPQSTQPGLEGTPAFTVGAGLTDPSQAASAAARVRLLRFGLTWPAGATTVDAATAAMLQSLPASVSSMIELAASPLPVDDAGRAALAQYAASIVAQVRSLRALVLSPAPTGATAGDYLAALTAIRVALPDAPLGIALDGSADPGGAVGALAGAAVEVVAFRPAAATGNGAWTLADLADVQSSFPESALVIDGLPAPYAASLKATACTTGIAGVVLDRVGDLTRAGVPAAARSAQRGTFVCPGVMFDALPFSIDYPDAPASPVVVSVNCNRDCLYLVTLDRADGRPAVARRGQIEGGANNKPTTIALPKVKLAAGTYRMTVRLVSRVNPGAVTKYTGPALTFG
jgi:hypothetical protein